MNGSWCAVRLRVFEITLSSEEPSGHCGTGKAVASTVQARPLFRSALIQQVRLCARVVCSP
jgi:hypothetical protein